MDSEIFLAMSILDSGDEEIEGAHGIAGPSCLNVVYCCLNCTIFKIDLVTILKVLMRIMIN